MRGVWGRFSEAIPWFVAFCLLVFVAAWVVGFFQAVVFD